uniref:Uncharacterized protein n=1 Tax=Oryza meridionalis TaxID=40149 RepID=A0A0E0F8K6_9ORYZ
MEDLTSLKELVLEECDQIKLLPALPLSLETFLVAFCNQEFMNSCRTTDHPNWQRIKHIKNKLIPNAIVSTTAAASRSSSSASSPRLLLLFLANLLRSRRDVVEKPAAREGIIAAHPMIAGSGRTSSNLYPRLSPAATPATAAARRPRPPQRDREGRREGMDEEDRAGALACVGY